MERRARPHHRSRTVALSALPLANPPLRPRITDDGFGILDLAAPAEAAQGVRDPLQPHAFGAVSRELSTLLDKHELRKGTLRESEDLVAALRALVLDNVQSVIARCEGEAAAELARRETKTLRNVAATGRGLVLPLESYGSALQAALTTTHGLLQKHLLNGRPILDLGGRGVSASRSARDLPGTSVPFVEAQTAARVAVVSRLLEQASRQLPPLKTALTAFNDLLPTIYSGFAEQAPHLPPVANLASHVSQLASLPLCVVELEGRRSDASQLAEEVSYVKSAMQSWAMQLWYQQLLAARRRTRFLDRLDRLQARQRATVTKRLAFAGWRLHVWQSSTARQFRSMRAELFSSVTHVAKKEALRSQCDESGLEATGVDDREATPWVTGEAAGIPLHPTPPQSSQHFSSPRRAIEEVGETVAEPDAWLSVAEITTLQSNAVRVVRQLDLVAEVCRSQLQQQRSQLDRLTKQNGALRSKCDELERKVLEMTKQHTAASNAAAAAEHRAEAAEARAARLASRVGLQEHHPWRDASVDGLRSLCQPFPCPHREIPTAGPIQAVGDGNEELAPPTAHVILRDWVNSCLDELHRLEKGDYLAHGLQGLHPETLPTQGSAAALAFAHAQRVRAANLDSDFRDGILLSRLVYYLALPKYEARAAVQESQTTGTLPAELRALLVKPGAAALSPPWPPYHGAFGDFTSLSFTQRALTTVRIAASVLQMSPAAPGVDAAQVADGHAPAIALLLGLLFHHCAHPFQHKTNADHAQEKPTPAGLQGIRPPLSSKEAHPHLVAGRFWPAVFLETSSDLKEFSTRVVQANESLRRYQWVVLRDVVASSAIAATRPSALGPRLLVATTEATAQRFVSAAIFSAAAVHIVSEVLGGAPKDAGTPTDDPDAPAVPDPDTTDAQEAVGLLSRYRRELVDLFLAHSVCSSDVPPGSPAATVGLPLKTWLDMCTATDVVPRYFGIDGATTLFVECNPSSAVLGPESEEERDALTNSHLLSLEEFLRLVIKAAGRLVRADRRTSMGSGVGSMCGSFVSLRGRGSVASDNSPSASLTVALQQLLAALLRLRHRGELDTFMDRFRGVTVQSVVGRYHADVAAVLGLYSTRAVNGTPAIDLQQFLRILRDASAITPEFSSAAAAELYTTVQTIPSVPSSSGVAAFIATDDHDAPDRQVSPARRRTLDGRRRSRSSSPAAPVPPEVKPADRPMHLPAFVLTLAIMACHRYPSPLQRLQEKLELFLTRGFLDTIRPKLSQLIKRRNQSVAGESARPR